MKRRSRRTERPAPRDDTAPGATSVDTHLPERVSTRARTSIRTPETRTRASDAGRSRLGDLTRPIPVNRRITRRRRSTFLFGLAALGIAGALAAALFVLPVQTWFAQESALDSRQAQLDQLSAVNVELQAEVNRLRTEAGIREAAREEIGYAEEGERRLTVLSFPDLPTDLPPGWPYDLVTQVIELRSAPPAVPEDLGPTDAPGEEPGPP